MRAPGQFAADRTPIEPLPRYRPDPPPGSPKPGGPAKRIMTK
jgi:hypothetical protein